MTSGIIRGVQTRLVSIEAAAAWGFGSLSEADKALVVRAFLGAGSALDEAKEMVRVAKEKADEAAAAAAQKKADVAARKAERAAKKAAAQGEPPAKKAKKAK